MERRLGAGTEGYGRCIKKDANEERKWMAGVTRYMIVRKVEEENEPQI